MGEVYRAKDTKLGRDVAIKVLSSGFATDEERLRRFEQALDHLPVARRASRNQRYAEGDDVRAVARHETSR
jgi:serine/threonine protein kinase